MGPARIWSSVGKDGQGKRAGSESSHLVGHFQGSMFGRSYFESVLIKSQVQSSCGFGVPFLGTTAAVGDGNSPNDVQLELKDRETLGHWALGKIEKNQLQGYQAEWNSDSLDGLVGLTVARRNRGDRLWFTSARAWVRRVSAQKDTFAIGMLLGMIIMFLVQVATARL